MASIDSGLTNGADLPVLVVDDNAIVRTSTTMALKSLGIDAEAASGGQEALRKLSERNYAAVIMDYRMPEMSGADCTREIRRRERITHTRIPVIGYSADKTSQIGAECKDAGMDAVLSKEVPIGALVEMIKSFRG
jgi:CheY-like chemotaxis protein